MRSVQRPNFVVRAIALVCLLGGGIPLLSAGCGGSLAASVCQAACDCAKCTDSELDDCVQTLTESEKVAAKVGCEDQASDYEACVAGRGDCLIGFFITGECDSLKGSLDACLAKSGCVLESDSKISCEGPQGGGP